MFKFSFLLCSCEHNFANVRAGSLSLQTRLFTERCELPKWRNKIVRVFISNTSSTFTANTKSSTLLLTPTALYTCSQINQWLVSPHVYLF